MKTTSKHCLLAAGLLALTPCLTATADDTRYYANGYGVAWAHGTPKPSPASCINYAANATTANAILVATTAGKFDLELRAPAHVLVDVVGVITP